VVLSQSDPVSGGEPASIAVYPPRDMLSAAEALDLSGALASAADSLQQGAAVAVRRVEVVQVLPDLVALRDTQGGVRTVGSTADLLTAAELAIEDPSSAAWRLAEGEWSAELAVDHRS